MSYSRILSGGQVAVREVVLMRAQRFPYSESFLEFQWYSFILGGITISTTWESFRKFQMAWYHSGWQAESSDIAQVSPVSRIFEPGNWEQTSQNQT